MVLTREVLTEKAPELLAALVKEGQDAGSAAERARLQAIDELGLKGCDDLIAQAKYGEKPMDAPALAVAALKAGKQAGIDIIAARRAESVEAASVRQSPPAGTRSDEERATENMKRIAQNINAARKGGK